MENISHVLLKAIGVFVVYILSVFLIFYGLILAAYFNDAIGIEVMAGSIQFIIEVIAVCLFAVIVAIMIARLIMKFLKNKRKYVGVVILVVLVIIALSTSPLPFIYVIF